VVVVQLRLELEGVDQLFAEDGREELVVGDVLDLGTDNPTRLLV
jgi:hypothetical protein